jgi:hypothetical protein
VTLVIYAVEGKQERQVTGAHNLFAAQQFFVRGKSRLTGMMDVPIKLHFFSPSGVSINAQETFPCITFITHMAQMKPILGDYLSPLFSNANVVGRYIKITGMSTLL